MKSTTSRPAKFSHEVREADGSIYVYYRTGSGLLEFRVPPPKKQQSGVKQ